MAPHTDQLRSQAPVPTESALPDLKDEVLLELVPDAILIVDERGLIQIANGQAEQLFGYSRAELIGQPVELLVPPRQRKFHVQHRGRYVAEPKARPMGAGLDLTALRKDGSEVPVEISLSPVSTQDGLMIIGVIRDVSARRRLEEAALSARAIAAQEQERVRIARELHDEIAQALSGIALGLEQIESAPRLEKAREQAKGLGDEVTNAMGELRRVIEHLRPDELADVGLVAALKHMADERQERNPNITILFHSHESLGRLDPETELAAYRVVQEALTNALKHGDPTTIEISLSRTNGTATARVRDDGCGFDVEAPTDGLGLGGMGERARLVRGELKIDSSSDRGTEVALSVPVAPT